MASLAEINLVKNIESLIEERIKNGGQVGALEEAMKQYRKDKQIEDYHHVFGDRGLETFMEKLDER